MSLLKPEFKDSEILEIAYRTVASRLNEPLCPISQAIPEMPNPEQLTGLQLKALIEEYDSEIKRFRNVLTGRLKSRISIFEPPTDNMNMQRAKRLEQDHRNDMETIKKGTNILEKRRGTLRKRLNILRLSQITVQPKVAEGKRIVEKASQLNSEILKEVQKVKQMLSEMDGLRAKYNNIYNEFQKANLDPEKQLPPFNVEVPRTIQQLFR